MALSPREQQIAAQWFHRLPGARGRDIPADTYDQMYSVANGVTLPIWGRPILPHQLKSLYDMGATTPAAIHAELGKLPHPHAPGLSLGEYQEYAQAHRIYRDNK